MLQLKFFIQRSSWFHQVRQIQKSLESTFNVSFRFSFLFVNFLWLPTTFLFPLKPRAKAEKVWETNDYIQSSQYTYNSFFLFRNNYFIEFQSSRIWINTANSSIFNNFKMAFFYPQYFTSVFKQSYEAVIMSHIIDEETASIKYLICLRHYCCRTALNISLFFYHSATNKKIRTCPWFVWLCLT